MKFIKAVIIIVLLLVTASVILWLGGGRRKLGEIFQQVPVYDVTGSWQVTANITSPYPTSGIFLAVLDQDESGLVSGTITDEQGGNSNQVTGQVTGNQFTTDPTEVAVETTPPGGGDPATYVVRVSFIGTIEDGNSRISGNISGELIDPFVWPLAGTFFADKIDPANGGDLTPTSTPTPTSSPVPTNTSTPTPTSSPTPTPTRIPTATPTRIPTATPTRIPTSTPTNIPTSLPTNTLVPTSTPILPPDRIACMGLNYSYSPVSQAEPRYNDDIEFTCVAGGVDSASVEFTSMKFRFMINNSGVWIENKIPNATNLEIVQYSGGGDPIMWSGSSVYNFFEDVSHYEISTIAVECRGCTIDEGQEVCTAWPCQ
jgi:hypothetical protein